MSHFLDRLKFFNKTVSTFSDGHGAVVHEDRTWENAYRQRWQHDKIVRSTHGVNCTGSCSWKVYVKNGLITWETQQTDYPRTRPDLPNHEPRGCARGASYSWYLYSANRVKYPMIRARLLKHWRAALLVAKSPVDAWASIVENPIARLEWQKQRGLGGFVLPVLFGALVDLTGVRSSAFMLLYGTVCVSLVWMHFSFKPLRAAPSPQLAGA